MRCGITPPPSIEWVAYPAVLASPFGVQEEAVWAVARLRSLRGGGFGRLGLWLGFF